MMRTTNDLTNFFSNINTINNFAALAQTWSNHGLELSSPVIAIVSKKFCFQNTPNLNKQSIFYNDKMPVAYLTVNC